MYDIGLFSNRQARLSPTASWSQRRDSNPQPADYKSAALPIEPRWQTPAGPQATDRTIPLTLDRVPGNRLKASGAGYGTHAGLPVKHSAPGIP